jgi:hypothetical protein
MADRVERLVMLPGATFVEDFRVLDSRNRLNKQSLETFVIKAQGTMRSEF